MSWSEILLTIPENCTILSSHHCVEIGEQTRCIHRNIVTNSQKIEGDDWKAEKVFQFQYHHFNQFLDWISLLRCQELENVKTNYPFLLLLHLRITKLFFQDLKYNSKYIVIIGKIDKRNYWNHSQALSLFMNIYFSCILSPSITSPRKIVLDEQKWILSYKLPIYHYIFMLL